MADVIEVRAQHGFDEARLDRFLTANVAGYPESLTGRQREDRRSNPTSILGMPGARYVLLQEPPDALVRE